MSNTRLLCRLHQRVRVLGFNSEIITGEIIGVGYLRRIGVGDLELGCIVALDRPVEAPNGYMVQTIVVNPDDLVALP